MSSRMTRTLAVTFLVLLAVIFSGCLVADKSVAAAYDSATDEFRFLFIYQRIRGYVDDKTPDPAESQARDEQWLKTLYANRDHVLLMPADLMIFSDNAFLRLSDNQYSVLGLGDTPKTLQAAPAVVPLNDIRIEPGRFFLAAPDNLCCYHQIVIPGKTADALLAHVSDNLAATSNSSLISLIDVEILRRQVGGTWLGWDDFKPIAIAQFLASIHAGPNLNAAPSNCPFETASLVKLRAQLARKLPFTRQGAQIETTVELTPKDVAGINSFIDDLRIAVGQAVAHPPEGITPDQKSQIISFSEFLNSVTAATSDANHLQLTLDVISAFGALQNPLAPLQPLDDKSTDQSKHMIELASRNLDIDKNITIQSVVADFKANTLKSYPANPPIPPGTGMVPVTPATQP